ncbi:MAG TPA: hypothetical protein VMH35_00450 [Streptosporangiaceae bacterium]|nr:hypothetical protein [Streptosporangiaceae bacterium]
MAATPAQPGSQSWAALRAQVMAHEDGLAMPGPPGPAECRTCRGPVLDGYRRCFQCGLHAESAPGRLADLVVPIAYAPKGSPLARQLWQYKSARPAGRAAAQRWLRTLLLVFLREHGPCLWRAAAMPPASHVAVVPSCRGRPGPHPLATLIAPYLALAWAGLAVASPDAPGCHDLDPGRFRATRPLPGASVLLLDDTWTTGGSAQGAAGALRAAGARHVAMVVVGRHLNRPAAALGRPFRLDRCAVQELAPVNRLDP